MLAALQQKEMGYQNRYPIMPCELRLNCSYAGGVPPLSSLSSVDFLIRYA
jgi:hypothetical protein